MRLRSAATCAASGNHRAPRRAFESKPALGFGAAAAWFLLTWLSGGPASAAERSAPPSPEDAALRQAVAALFSEGPATFPEPPEGVALASEDAAALEFARAMALDSPGEFEPAALALMDDPALPPAARLALEHHLSLLPVRQAERLRAESRWNLAAEGVNIVLASPVSLIQGGGTVIARTALAFGRLFGSAPLSPRERKEFAVLRELLRSEGKRLAPEERERLAERYKSLRERWRRDASNENSERVREALRHYHFAEARFYLERLRKIDAEAFAELRPQAERQEKAWRRGRGFALTLAPDIDGGDAISAELLALATLDGPALRNLARGAKLDPETKTYLFLMAAALDGKDRDAARLGERLAEGEDTFLARFGRELQEDAALYPLRAAEEAEDYYRARVNYYILAGRRDLGEHAYIAAYGAAGGGPGLANFAAFHVLDAGLRWIGGFFRSPLPPEDAVDAWVLASEEASLSREEKAFALMSAAELRAWAGEAEAALALAEEAASLNPAFGEELPAYREDAARDLFRRAIPSDPVERRRSVWGAVEARYPETKFAAKARESLAELPPPLPPDARAIPAERLREGGLWAGLGASLPVEPRLLDGKTHNGEILRLVASPARGLARAELEDGSTLELPPRDRSVRKLAALAGIEADALALRASREELLRTQYLPLRIEGGIGAGGVDAAPQLKRRPFRDRDARLYRR